MAAVHINHNEFENLMKSGKPVLVDFWAPWCTYCRRISDAYDRIAEQYGERIHVVKVNIDENEALAEQEKIEIIPTLVLYRGGEAVGSIVAPESKAAIDAFIAEHTDSATVEEYRKAVWEEMEQMALSNADNQKKSDY